MGGGNVSQDQTSIICIDLKSFYASVECVERGLNPFKTNLVVADPTRSKSTICLAITPAMKSLGIKNRCRIHEMLTYSHIEYVLHCMRGNTTKVKNIKKYLLASLFNAPSTMNGYYQAEVNHDMPGLVR